MPRSKKPSRNSLRSMQSMRNSSTSYGSTLRLSKHKTRLHLPPCHSMAMATLTVSTHKAVCLPKPPPLSPYWGLAVEGEDLAQNLCRRTQHSIHRPPTRRRQSQQSCRSGKLSSGWHTSCLCALGGRQRVWRARGEYLDLQGRSSGLRGRCMRQPVSTFLFPFGALG